MGSQRPRARRSRTGRWEFSQEQVRWWDRWLKGIDNGIDREPMLTVWLQDRVAPQADLAHRPGAWVVEEEWPSARIKTATFEFGHERLVPTNGVHPPTAAAHRPARTLRGSQLCGLDSGAWCADGRSPDLAPDQRREDGLSLTWDSEPLAEPLAILGRASTVLELAADRPQALVCVRLCDVAPDGALAPCGPRAAQPESPRRPREPATARPGRPVHGDGATRRDRAPLPGRTPAPGRGLRRTGR